MFKKNYIFESSHTRSRRHWLAIIFTITVLLLTFTTSMLVIIVDAQNESRRSEDAFYQRAPDLIVVFTGDRGRIQFALAKAREYQLSNILISGVYSKNTVETFLKSSVEGRGEIDQKLLEIDYQARNTFENILNLQRYLSENPGHNRILIISHDYHISRIKLLMMGLMNDRSNSLNSTFYYSAVPTSFREWSNLQKLLKEMVKIVRNAFMVAFWDEDSASSLPPTD
jgi:uncharacterized SAM-binding protein YcdF (DUF218 family)